ncbi:MAG: rhodanese-like domain-containing protein [Planctomycetota bacterium]|nr:rhodanese-like domain-containing protein [Planctomycetota bacterium]
MLPTEISTKKVKELLDAQDDLLLLDCRRDDEYAICQIDGSILIPMDELPTRIGELEAAREKPVVVYCHHGMRSLRVVNWLRQQGFDNSQSMSGGIHAWSEEIDPSVPTY